MDTPDNQYDSIVLPLVAWLGERGVDIQTNCRVTDLGFFVHREMERIVETQPRLRQALQILRDLGLTIWEPERLPQLTPLGEAVFLELAE